MGVVNTTYTFTGTDTVTSDKLNNLIDETTFTGDAIQGTTLQVVSGKLAVRGSGITSNEMAANSVTTTAITDGSVTPTKLSTNGPSWTSTATGGVFAVQQNALEIGTKTVSDYACFVDFHSAATPTDFECRLVRDAGINGNFNIINTGTGAITLSSTGGVAFGSANMPIPSGTAPIYGARAWVNFNAQANTDIAGTYTRTSSTTVTITATAHGLIAGNAVFVDFTVGTGTAPFDGLYLVDSVTDANTFTVISSTTTTSTGTATLKRKTIRGSGNVSCVSAAYSGANPASPPASNQVPDNGYYVMNFTTAMSDSNFAVSGSCNEAGVFATSSGNDIVGGFGYNEKCAFVTTVSGGSNAVDCLHNSVQIIR